MIVAIDGPAGAGKSTVAKALAQRLRFGYLDTGALYRCVALAAIERFGGEAGRPERAGDVAKLAAALQITLAPGGRVSVDGVEATGQIRSAEISEMASTIAAIEGVRAALLVKQQQAISSGDWVAEGRDVGTVVAPSAEVKVFLDADPAARAHRRAAELGADAALVLAEQAMRDARDAGRQHAPLQAAADAVALDTTAMSVEEVVQAIAALVGKRSGRSY